MLGKLGEKNPEKEKKVQRSEEILDLELGLGLEFLPLPFLW